MHSFRFLRGIARAGITFGLAALGLAAGTGAHAQSVYVDTDLGEFGTLDLATGDFTPTNSLTLYGMGFTSDGTLYGVDDSSFLHQIDPATGVISGADLVQASGGDVVYSATTSGGLVYSFTGTPPHTLFSFDPTTQQETDILLHSNDGTDPDIQPDGLMAADGGVLYATGFAGDLYRVTAAGDLSTVGSTDLSTPFYAGVFVGGTLYGFNSDGNIYTLDTATGAATETRPYNLGNAGTAIFAAASAPAAAPEPSQAAALGLGVLGLGALGLRARKRGPTSPLRWGPP